MQDFAGSTVVHYQGALAALAGALLLGPRIGKFDGKRGNAIPATTSPTPSSGRSSSGSAGSASTPARRSASSPATGSGSSPTSR
jgi:ammonia channel protein AmtB